MVRRASHGSMLLLGFVGLATLAAAASTLRVDIKVKSELVAGSKSKFEYMFSYELNGEWQPLPLDSHFISGQVLELSLPIEGFPGPAAYFGLRTKSDDALGLESITIDGVPVMAGVPYWIDDPCTHAYNPGCAPAYVWSVVLPTTTTMTTSTTGTVTSTSISLTSSTSTSATATTTTTSTSTTIALVLSPLEAFKEELAPEPFYDEVEVDLVLSANQSILEGLDLNKFAPEVSRSLLKLVGLHPPSGVECQLIRRGTGEVKVKSKFLVMAGSKMTAVQIQATCKKPGFVSQINQELQKVGPKDSQWTEKEVEVAVTGCQTGQMFCCVNAVVHNIVSNAGVLEAYNGSTYILSFMVLAMIPVLAVWRFGRGRFQSEEARRGFFVMPLMTAGAASQALVMCISAYNKYCAIAERRSLPGAVQMDLDAERLALKEVVVGCLALFFVIAISCWWYLEWQEDCAAGDLQGFIRWRPVMPLESMIRRSHLWGILEMRKEDRLSHCDLALLSAADLLITFAVALTSFFMLQRYKFPGLLTAWHPVKMVYELILGALGRKAFRGIALNVCSGRMRLIFVCLGIVSFGMVDLIIWISIFSALFDRFSDLTAVAVRRTIDIAFSAGMVNFLVSQLCMSFILRFVSVYWYEPHVRYPVLRCAYIVEESQIQELRFALKSSEGCWKILGVRHPPQLRRLDKAFAERIQAAVWSPSEVSREDCHEDCRELTMQLKEEDMSEANPLVLQLQRADSTGLALLCKVLDVLFSVEKHLPVEPRWKRAKLYSTTSEYSGAESLSYMEEENAKESDHSGDGS